MAEIVGRPTVMTPEVIRKLEEVFAIGGTDEEALFYADISKSVLYDYQKEHPAFTERKNKLKQKPFLLARQTIIKSLDQPEYAFEYMKRKKKDEFSERSEILGNIAVADVTLEDLFDRRTEKLELEETKTLVTIGDTLGYNKKE